MWTPATRRKHSREGLRYETDLSDREWVVIEPNLPPPAPLARRTRRLFPFIERIYADGGYQGPEAAKAAARTGQWRFKNVERSATAVSFEALAKRWIVARTFASIGRFRRMARDFERYARTVAAFIRLAMFRVMLRRLTKSCRSTQIRISRIGT